MTDRELDDNNIVPVAKTGGRGISSSSQNAYERNFSLGVPRKSPLGGNFVTRGGVEITANVQPLSFVTEAEMNSEEISVNNSARTLQNIIEKLDYRRGLLLTSSYEYPGRYSRWSLGFVDPPIVVEGSGRHCMIRALNKRGLIILPAILGAMKKLLTDGILENISPGDEYMDVTVVHPSIVGTFREEDRSRQPSLISVVRSLVDLFGFEEGDGQLGLYGAFGYDLTFQFEPIKQSQNRDINQRDILLYIPDEIVVVDPNRRDAWTISYDFCINGISTQGLSRSNGESAPFRSFEKGNNDNISEFKHRDTPKYEFSKSVERAKKEFLVGNLFEVVLSQTFREKLDRNTPPSVLFQRLIVRNPSPFGFLINLGKSEFLVGTSPEMFVRCEKVNDNNNQSGLLRVETCPISGTVARGADAIEDAERIKSLIINEKEESELTMCTDVDRNDKSRVCKPGSVKVIGRRQIEMYSRLIHTVDHVEGYLSDKFDALDAFLCHTWAVTVTGAPKSWAVKFIEDNEKSPRCWYGGAIGMVGFDGSLNTGLTLRTVRVKDGMAEVRAGATLLYDSNAVAEEQETELKASAMMDAIMHGDPDNICGALNNDLQVTNNRKLIDDKKIILIDHEDSFVHTLGNYLRQIDAKVKTLRSGPSSLAYMKKMIHKGNKPDLVVLSPGPGNPSNFGLPSLIEFLAKNKIPAFGVCLGLQGMVEYFGGTLGVLNYPKHGKSSHIFLNHDAISDSSIFSGLPVTFEVARYHSLYGIKEMMPSCLDITALDENGIVMAIKHKTLPFAAVQFHPESILTSYKHGIRILKNALKFLVYDCGDVGAN